MTDAEIDKLPIAPECDGWQGGRPPQGPFYRKRRVPWDVYLEKCTEIAIDVRAQSRTARAEELQRLLSLAEERFKRGVRDNWPDAVVRAAADEIVEYRAELVAAPFHMRSRL